MALYLGTNGLPYPASALMANAFIRAIESPMFFTANTIDQPGKQIALAAHGHWLGGDVDFHEADSWMLVGTNPLVSKAIGIPGQNPAQGLKNAIARGMKLIVIDPAPIADGRARRDAHSAAARRRRPQFSPESSTSSSLKSSATGEFLDENVEGFDELAAAVSRLHSRVCRRTRRHP